MRHRVVSVFTGIGNADPVILDNKGKLNKKFANEVTDLYFKKIGGFDFKVTKNSVLVGIEPAYQYERLIVICINKNKKESYKQYGKAFGAYGSQIAKTTKFYKEYKNKCKFTKFVDKYHGILFKNKVG